jgi:hypothetical protein
MSMRVRLGWKPATLVAIAAAAALADCGSSDPLTSVYLEIYDSSVIQAPTQVTLNVFDAPGGNQIATLDRKASAQTSASSPLGSVVIFASTSGALGTLHIEGQRSSGGSITATGSVDVPLVASRQVSAWLMLGHDGGPGDAGATGSGGSSGSGGRSGGSGGSSGSGGSGGAGSSAAGGSSAGGSGGTTPPPADAGAPVDSGSTLAANGTSCRSGNTCTSGFCADSVCCNSACDALCHGCNLSGSRGTCTPFAAGSQCAPPSCTSTGNDLIPARTCDSNGNCNAAGASQSCGRYECQSATCLRSCTSNNACVSPFRCFQNRCQ